ncbi:MAG: group III truncated hemoglobin [Saprospiraceae bacterium]|nr:group III truncated hemoglobin [Saprospiraceae bacterium]
MKTDIRNRQDIELLINSFYDKVKKDPTIGYFFNKVIAVNWEKHLPVMYNFWESILFYTGSYEGNPMMLHLQLHQKSPLQVPHFQQWLYLFTETTDELFEGENAELIKQKAHNIAGIMQVKIISP